MQTRPLSAGARTFLGETVRRGGPVIRGLVVVAGACLFSMVTWAQGGEVSGFGGGFTVGGGFGTHAVVGGAGAFRLGEHVHIFGEVSHSNILSETVSGVTGTAGLTNFGGGADYSFGSSRVRPYVLGMMGAAHIKVSALSVGIGLGNSLYAGFGGGVRLYVTDHFGIKPEVRYQRYLTNELLQGANATAYTVGVFYQIGN